MKNVRIVMGRSCHVTAVLFALLMSAIARLHAQGDLSPPAGAPAPALRTLDQVEPRVPINATRTPGNASSQFVISQPGSYYLTGPLSALGHPGQSAIAVTANDVTIDLKGFVIDGLQNQANGIDASGVSGLTVVNGTLLNWAWSGIGAGTATACRISHISARANGVGIWTGADSRISDCIICENTGYGINSGDKGVVTDCILSGNGNRGLYATSHSMVMRCVAGAGNAMGGIATGPYSLIDSSIACGNSLNGVEPGDSSQIRRVVACANGGAGSAGIGISAGANVMIDRCTANNNRADGIRIADRCTLLANLASANGLGAAAAGIHATGSLNKLDANQTRDNNNTGIKLDAGAAANTTIHNSSGGNTTNYSPASGASLAPIQSPSTATSGWSNF